MLENVKRNVRLVARIDDNVVISDGERRRLQRKALDEIKQALQPFGYYRTTITTEFDRPTLSLVYLIELNDPVFIRSINLSMNDVAVLVEGADSNLSKLEKSADKRKGNTSEGFRKEFNEWRDQFELQSGEILNHSIYEKSKKTLLAKALRLGYFDAKYDQSSIEVGVDRATADIILIFSPGRRYQISDVVLSWEYSENADAKTKRGIDPSILSSMITLEVGKYYNSERLSETQRNLSSATFFAGVEVSLGDLNRDELQVPIVINLKPRKRKAYNFEIGVGTDTGIRASVGYENRRINTKGHNVSARYAVSEISRTAIFNYRIPYFRKPTESVNIFASQNDTFGKTRRFSSSKIGAELRHEMDGAVITYGLTASREQYSRLNRDLFDVERTTDLLIPSVQWKFTEVDDLYFPTRGWSATVELRGASEDALSDIDLMQGELDLRKLFPFGSGSFKMRLSLAGSLIDESADLPESLGFLAGGDDSVRGYRFESIGVTQNGETTVGKHAIVASVEYQHPIRDGLALAAFVDMGDAFNSNVDLKKGAGLGLRWRLPFGALRLDLASALDLEGNPLRLHFSFGADL
ncbi:MAG TPA: hypothetical protein DCW52_10625 [Gammaproteobacteria bacterium]|nr:hypothetical protein [Gammaproteobacteria bacterium]